MRDAVVVNIILRQYERSFVRFYPAPAVALADETSLTTLRSSAYCSDMNMGSREIRGNRDPERLLVLSCLVSSRGGVCYPQHQVTHTQTCNKQEASLMEGKKKRQDRLRKESKWNCYHRPTVTAVIL